MPNVGPKSVLLFDLDGTIADTHGLIMKCYDHAIREHIGKPGLRQIWEARIGLPLDDILTATYAHYGQSVPTVAQLDAVKHTYRTHMRDNDDSIQSFGGVEPALIALRSRGYALGIVTTKHRKMALRHLSKLCLLSYFDERAVICGDMGAECKPSPEPIWMAIRALNCIAEHAAMIGDSMQDILAARAANVYAIAACWGTDNRDSLLAAGPDQILESPSGLIELFAGSG